MTLTYTLAENDFLQHQLFIASKTERIKKQRVRTWLLYTASLLFLGLIFYQSGNIVMTYYFSIFGLIFFCFFPLYQKNYYKSHYQKFIADTYRNRIGQAGTVSLNEDSVQTSDISGESKIYLSEIENITETGDYFYIKMRISGYLILPKYKLAEPDNVRQELKKTCRKLSVDFIEDLNWRWK